MTWVMWRMSTTSHLPSEPHGQRNALASRVRRAMAVARRRRWPATARPRAASTGRRAARDETTGRCNRIWQPAGRWRRQCLARLFLACVGRLAAWLGPGFGILRKIANDGFQRTHRNHGAFLATCNECDRAKCHGVFPASGRMQRHPVAAVYALWRAVPALLPRPACSRCVRKTSATTAGRHNWPAGGGAARGVRRWLSLRFPYPAAGSRTRRRPGRRVHHRPGCDPDARARR